jgi:phage tail sheath protein FI
VPFLQIPAGEETETKGEKGMNAVSVPGVYVEDQKYALSPLRMDKSCCAGFVGIAERGPLNRLVLVDSFDAYSGIFGGFDTAGVLPLSVYSFFKCGGSRCAVVRVAAEKEARPARLSLKCEGGGFIRFTAKSEGAWANHIAARVWHEKGGSAEKRFSLRLSCKKRIETYLDLSLNPKSGRYYLPFINSRSALCAVEGENPKGPPRECFALRAEGGADGIADMSAGDFIGWYGGTGRCRGIGAFEGRDDIDLIAAPDLSWLLLAPGKSRGEKEENVFSAQAALVNQARMFPGRFAVLDAPDRCDIAQAAAWARKFDSASAALYYPAVEVLDPLDPGGAKTVRIPPSGAVCGCIAAQEARRGIFYAPANVTLCGAAAAAYRPTAAEEDFLYSSGVNVLKYFPGQGVKIWGCRTLSSDPAWKYINVRRTFSRISRSLKKGTQWAVFEPNTGNLRKRLARQVSGFLLDLWTAGCLAGTTPGQAFFVRCDEELNPPENAGRGILTFEAGVAITRPLEFFRIRIIAEKEGGSVYVEQSL